MQKDLLVESGAEFSSDRVHRYSLWRIWDRDKAYAAFVGLNPSTADEYKNDPTVRRCINYARDWGYGGLIMLNIFAYRSTDPRNLYTVADPVGPDNDFHIRTLSSNAGVTVAAWGNHGELLNRGEEAKKLLTNPQCLKLTKAGCPGHPLYLRKDLHLMPCK
ncbi:MAG: DUF1643 domain-containing protein [Candidatus Sabulitectum sp.]|nr:DUF1643 domain-containing protein [Candidatus Sabulitectum sp.]